MIEIFKINNISFHDVNTTVLCPSNYNMTNDAISFLHENCSVISSKSIYDFSDISEELLTLFNCSNLKAKKFLTKIDAHKLSILTNLENPEKVFIFMGVLSYLDYEFKTKVIKYLKDHSKIIINYTSDIEETLFLDYIIVIHENKVVMEGTNEQILNEEKILKKLGYKLPFVLDLSKNLKYYGLTTTNYYDLESLVNALWK